MIISATTNVRNIDHFLRIRGHCRCLSLPHWKPLDKDSVFQNWTTSAGRRFATDSLSTNLEICINTLHKICTWIVPSCSCSILVIEARNSGQTCTAGIDHHGRFVSRGPASIPRYSHMFESPLTCLAIISTIKPFSYIGRCRVSAD
jgi:hypothetical protein